MCYFEFSVGEDSYSFLYVMMENLVFWKEICEPGGLRVPLFCALRVGGKSGSWDYTHSPRRGKLWGAIRDSHSPHSNRPVWWIADDNNELRDCWDGIGFDGEGRFHEERWYGIPHYFRCDWSCSVTVVYRDGTRVDYPVGNEPPEYSLAVACYQDYADEVKRILEANPTVDVNSAVMHSKWRGNGTPLVLTGSAEIAGLLIARGADVNHCYNNGHDLITPLDSALRELSNRSVRGDAWRKGQALAMIQCLESAGGKRARELGADRGT
jgi:hypothetical protein